MTFDEALKGLLQDNLSVAYGIFDFNAIDRKTPEEDDIHCTVYGEFVDGSFEPLLQLGLDGAMYLLTFADRIYKVTLKHLKTFLKAVDYSGLIGIDCVVTPCGKVYATRFVTTPTTAVNNSVDFGSSSAYDTLKDLKLVKGIDSGRRSQVKQRVRQKGVHVGVRRPGH